MEARGPGPPSNYAQPQGDLVEARSRFARAIGCAAMSGMSRNEIVEATGYDSESILRIWPRTGDLHLAASP